MYNMTNNEIVEKLNNILIKQFGLEKGEIGPDKHLVNDLGADSLDIMEIVTDCETEFNIVIEEFEYEKCNNVQDVVDLISKKLKSSQ